MNPLPSRVPAPASLAPLRPLARLATATMLLSLLAACGGSDDSTSAPPPPPPPPAPAVGSVAVTAALGVVGNADVSVTCAPTGSSLGTGSTSSTGVVTVTTSGSCSGPVLVTVSGRSDGSSIYFDEAAGASLPFPAGSSLRAVAPAFASPMALGVTPLTEIATRRALTVAGSLAALSAAQVSSANTGVVTQLLGSGVSLDILTPPTPWNASTATGSLGTSAADRYAFYLAGLAHMGTGLSAPALAVTSALASDLADGTLGGSSSGFLYTASGLAAQLSASLNGMAAYASPALQAALGVAPPATLVAGSFAPTSGAAGTTVTISGSGFDPDPFHVQVKFADNLTAEVVSSSATTLVVKVPAGAVTGPIQITNTLRFQSITTSTSFTVSSTGGGGGGGGTAWVSRASPSGFLLNGLAYGAGRFVAAGFSRTLLSSANGLSWDAATPPDSNYFQANAVIWTGTQFVMVGDKVFGFAGAALIATSPDGLVWTRRSWTPGSCCEIGALTDVASGGGRLTVAGDTVLASSSDGGLNWTVDNLPTGVFPTISGLAGNDSTRVAVGRQAGVPTMLVDTGSGWALATGTLDATHMPADVAWAGSGFVAVGGRAVMRSADGRVWTTAVLPESALPSGIFLGKVAAVGGVLYATGDNFGNRHAILKSDDGGETWSLVHQETTSGNAMLAGIAASPDRVVTVGGVKSVTLP